MTKDEKGAPALGAPPNNSPATESTSITADQTEALRIAGELIKAGVPVFVATPNGTPGAYVLPSGWQHSMPDLSVLDQWRPGMALAAVGGHVADFLDFDPRNGSDASLAELEAAGHKPRAFGIQATPSGGEHHLISLTGERKCTGFMPGVDLQSGTPEGGRGFVWIAPTVRPSKATGELVAYRWTQAPDMDYLADFAGADDSVEGIVDRIRAKRAARPVSPAPDGASQLFGALAGAARTFTRKQAEEFCSPAIEALERAQIGEIEEHANRAAATLSHFVPSHWSADEAFGVLMVALGKTAYDPNRQGSSWTAEKFRAVLDGRRPPLDNWKATLVSQEQAESERKPLFVDGEAFLDSISEDELPLWGNTETCLWAPGESLMLVGPPGVGKSTLAHLVVWARLGINKDALSMGIEDDGGKVLYLAMDRPKQIGRAMKRLMRDGHREVLRERLLVHRGPLPINVVKEPEWVLQRAVEIGATTVVVDSLKDLVPNLSDEEAASQYNKARQLCLKEGIEWLELHHNRKTGAEGKPPKTLDDVYGSRWLTAGAGSVVSLFGQSGDAVVEMTQIKTPSGDLFPKKVAIDKEAGTMSYFEEVTLESLMGELTDVGESVKNIACKLYGKAAVSASEIESTRQKLKRFVKAGKAEEIPGKAGVTNYRPADSNAPSNA